MYERKFVHNKRVAAGLGVLRQLPIAINNLCCSSKLKGTVEVIDKIQDIMAMVDHCTGTNSGS